MLEKAGGDYTYRYSIGPGRETTVFTRDMSEYKTETLGDILALALLRSWRLGNGYTYGVLPPRYPVPAIPLVVSYQGVVWPNIVIRTPYSAPIRNQIIRIWKQEG